MRNTAELKSRGMKCLTEQLGVVDAEQFIAAMLREQFDYAKWRREFYEAMKPGEFLQNAADYAQAHPFQGNAKKLILS